VHVDLKTMTTHHAHRVWFALALALAACGPSAKAIDGGTGSDGDITADASLIGTSCTTAAECPGGYCIEGFGDHICTDDCTVGCPSGWQCRATNIEGDLISVCVPPAFQLCTPCTGDTQCGDGVCVTLGGEGFCLPHCPFEGSCPQGYSCGVDPTGKNAGNFCVPMTQACTCTSGADEGNMRTCSKMTSLGTCQGLETCDPNAGGWVGCTAPTATLESCDGLDNDCNGLVDDGVASGQACAITVAGVGSCPGVTLCAGGTGVICQGKTPVTETCNYTDDDCDLMVDEGYANLNTLCSAGVGGCQRMGVIRCSANGTMTQCTAVAGMPVAELCNTVDDNCNGQVDETFANKGQPCTVGTGACQRQGSNVCSANGATTTCSVGAGMPGTESCNTIDDDCDAKIDENFKDVNGNYTLANACGSCAVDCTAIYALPNAFGTCAPGPQCVMNCASGAFNLDGSVANGCEFPLDPVAVYVSIDGVGSADDATCGLGPTGTGAGNHPCLTIAQGIARATALNRARIFVANGVYSESVTLVNGRSLLGGYRPDNWVRDLAATGTVIVGVASIGPHDITVDASNITAATVFEGFAVYGSVNSKPGGNSYAIYAAGSNASLAIRSNVVLAGRGGPGSSGANGSDGGNGSNGAGRNPNLGVSDAPYDAKVTTGAGACASTNDRAYTNGGATSCGGDDVSGGNGGGNRCPAAPTATCSGCTCNVFGCGCTSCTFVTATSINGLAGQAGAGAGGGAGGTGAARGDDMINRRISGNDLCFIPTLAGMALPTYGSDGNNGSTGTSGTGVSGCTATGGGVVGGHWSGTIAASGITGANGGGGGGGGAGGGSKCDACQSSKDNFGGHGGGGGAGGCGGAAGSGATSGGGAFGIFITGATAPIVTANTMFRGEGGVGGSGGAAGRGGVGGSGATGGTTGSPALFCSDIAGRGGNGGNGGHGSGGAGGCGGAGGYSTVNPGGAGTQGALLDCSFN
jgi:hypothetical protein